MSDRKFFSGLPDGMMKRNPRGPDRQQTNFYWPDETDCEEFVPSRNRMRNRSMSTASLMSQSQASTDTEESRRRKSQQNKSKIEFYDMVDVGTDTESVYSRSNDLTRRKKQETLKSRIEFYDFVDMRKNQPEEDAQSVIERPIKRNGEASAPEQRVTSASPENGKKSVENTKIEVKSEANVTQSIQNLSLGPDTKNGFAPEVNRKKVSQNYAYDTFSESDDEERFYRNRNHALDDRKYLPPPPNRHPPSQRSVRSHPRRMNSEYFDFDDDEEYDRQYDSRRLRYRKPENIPRMVRRRDYSPEYSDEELYDNVDGYRRGGGGEYFKARLPPAPERYRSNASRLDESESNYRGRNNRRQGNGYTSGTDQQRSSQPPSRMSPPAEAPVNGHATEVSHKMPSSAKPPVKPLTRTMSINEARQRLHVNLRSNIFHNDPEYNQIVEQRKPVSVRDFAARQRVGVGLPDI